MKNRIDVNYIPEGFEWKDDVAVVLHENGWFMADMTCTTKSKKIALNRFFKAVPELACWREELENSAKGNDFLLASGEKNNCPSFAYEVDMSNACGLYPTVYIFLNVRADVHI